MKRQTGSKVVKFLLSAAKAQQRVRELAANSGNLVWTEHVERRMAERGIDSDAVLRILRTGDVEDEPRETEKAGDWKIKVVRKMNSGRVAGVVTVIAQNSRLVLVTTEWEDRR
jgi:FAD synthase